MKGFWEQGVFDLTDKVVLITGASRGVGRSMALRFAGEGAKVAALARTAEALDSLAAEADARNAILPMVCDVSDADAVKCAVTKIQKMLGPIDVLINNAGIYLEKPIIDTSSDEWRRLFDVNALGPFVVTRAVLPQMLERDAGRIINICSTASHIGYARQAAYVASKHALLGFTRVLSEEMHGTNIRAHAISPGGVNTSLVKGRSEVNLSEYMDPKEIAEIALFLARMDEIATMDEVVIRRTGSKPFRC